LSSIVILFDVQASFFSAVGGKKFAEVALEAVSRVGVEVAVGLYLGIGTATIADPIAVDQIRVKNTIGAAVIAAIVGGELISAAALGKKEYQQYCWH